MIILFEGVDNSGKTTIAQEFARMNNYSYFKYSSIDKQSISDQQRQLVHEAEEMYSIALLKSLPFCNIVIDRHYPSDYAYGQLYRNQSIKSIVKIDQAFASLTNHLIVICHKNDSSFKHDDFIPHEDYDKLRSLYFEFFGFTDANAIMLDTTDQNLSTQIAMIQCNVHKVMLGQFSKVEL